MPDERMEWTLSLEDQVSGQGKKMGTALEGVDRGLKKTGDTSEKVSKRMETAARKAADAHSFLALQVNALMDIAGRVGGVLERVGNTAYDFGKYAVQAAAFKEDTLTALEAVLGSKKAAADVFSEGVRFAAKTPFETKDVERWQKQLLVGGYTAKETGVLLRALGDVGAFNEFRPDIVDRLAEAMTRLRGEGRMAGDVMRELRGAGVQDGRVYAELNKIFGTTTVQTRALMEAGRIDANTGIVAIARAIAGIGGGKLGALTDKASTNITGLFSTLRSRPFELLMDLDTTPGYEKLRTFLGKMAAVFDPGGAAGKKIQGALLGTLSGAFDGLFGNLNNISEESIVDGLLKGIDVATNMGKAAWAGLGAAVEAALGNGKGLWDELTGPHREEAFKKITKAAEDFGATIGRIGTRLLKMGEYIEVIADGIDRALHPIDTLKTLGKLSWESKFGGASVNDNSWKALSPEAQSRVRRVALENGYGTSKSSGPFSILNNPFAGPTASEFIDSLPGKAVSSTVDPVTRIEAHRYTAARAEAMTLTAPNAAYVSAPEVRTPARGGNVVHVQISPQVIIKGGNNTQALADEVLQRLRQMLPSELMAALEQLGLEMGG